MPVTDIKEIRLLPTIVIGRLGSSPEPMHNYDVEVSGSDTFRNLTPAETLVVDPQSGEIVNAVTPLTVRFKDGQDRVKPVAPFIEVWARFEDDGDLQPLTLVELSDLNISPDDLEWVVKVNNLKMFRRTGVHGDRIENSLTISRVAQGTKLHEKLELHGTALNFKDRRSVLLGWVQYVKPTDAFPEIRFRFTPGPGKVFGHRIDNVVTDRDDAVYDAAAGPWESHDDDAGPANPNTPRARRSTNPGGIYARNRMTGGNLGYFDDSCDGIVEVRIKQNGGTPLIARARISAGPPDFAPDSFIVRTVDDELQQLLEGVEVDSVTANEVREIVRRALDTVRLMGIENLNIEFAGDAFPGISELRARDAHQKNILNRLDGLDRPPGSQEREKAVGALRSVMGLLRQPDAQADFSPTGHRRMPAMMRGSDRGLLTLTQRQINKIERAIVQFASTGQQPDTPVAAMTRLIERFQSMAQLHSAFDLDGGGSLADLFTDPPKLMAYLRTSSARGNKATEFGVDGDPLITPGDLDSSAFVKLITEQSHPMNFHFVSYKDAVSQKNGIDVVRDWIASL